MYDRKQQLCHLMRLPLSEFRKSCRKVGGPRRPSMRDCKAKAKSKDNSTETAAAIGQDLMEGEEKVKDDPCDPFIEGYCKYGKPFTLIRKHLILLKCVLDIMAVFWSIWSILTLAGGVSCPVSCCSSALTLSLTRTSWIASCTTLEKRTAI